MLERSDIEMFAIAAKPYYTDRLAYHNWHHAALVMRSVEVISNKINERQRSHLAVGALHVAAAWHDAGYEDDHIKLGFATKEHYSSHLASEFLRTQHIPSDFIDTVSNAILGTIHDADRETNEALVLHRADIRNLGWIYSVFRDNTVNLWFEESQLKGECPSWQQWIDQTSHFITWSIEEAEREFSRLGIDLGGPMSFDTLAERNRTMLLREAEPTHVIGNLS
jgi:hypothetical protein